MAQRCVSMGSQNVLDLRTAGGIFGRGAIQAPAAAAAVAAGSECQVFLDQRGQNATSNMAVGLTNADANFFGGICPNGEVVTLFGLQIAFWTATGATDIPIAGTPVMSQEVQEFCSVSLQLKGTQYNIGNVSLYPSGIGVNNSAMGNNGGRAVIPFRFPKGAPIQLRSNDQFYLTIRAELAGITLGNNADKIIFQVYCPASRGVALSNLSGA